VYVTGLPHDATVDEVAQVFSRKCGVIAEEIDSGRPRIKLYTDAKGEFKGDALIVFFKAPSVDMAITLLDDTEFRFGELGGSGRMRVMAADASYKKTKVEEAGSAVAKDKERAKSSARDKMKIIKKTQKLDARLADWDDDVPSALQEAGTGLGGNRPQKVVILKHMFTLQELEEDPAAILDIKEDIREECAKLGEVTNVVLYDLEEEGVASVRFREEDAARACVELMDGRSFAGQTVVAYLSEGKEGFKKSKKKPDEGEEEGH
jgi:HIV Tat-specific factor 1